MSTLASSPGARALREYYSKTVLQYGHHVTAEVFPSQAALELDLGRRIAEIVTDSVEARGRFSMALAGGSIPAIAAVALAVPSLQPALSRSAKKWHVFLAEETMQPLQHSQPAAAHSTYQAVQRCLLDQPAATRHAMTLFPLDSSLADRPAEAALAYETVLRGVVPDCKLDLLLLELQSDGGCLGSVSHSDRLILLASLYGVAPHGPLIHFVSGSACASPQSLPCSHSSSCAFFIRAAASSSSSSYSVVRCSGRPSDACSSCCYCLSRSQGPACAVRGYEWRGE